jgi:hypothetical protein
LPSFYTCSHYPSASAWIKHPFTESSETTSYNKPSLI